MTNPTIPKAINPQMKIMNNNKYNNIVNFNIKIEKTDNNKKETPKKDIFKPFIGKVVNNKRKIFSLCKGLNIESLNKNKNMPNNNNKKIILNDIKNNNKAHENNNTNINDVNYPNLNLKENLNLVPYQNVNSNPGLNYKLQNNALPENNILHLKFSIKSSKKKCYVFLS